MSAVAFNQRLRSSGVWAASGRIGSGMLLLMLHGILARVLCSADYGRYVLIESVALVLSVVCMAGIPTVTLRLMRSSLATGDESQTSMTVNATLRLFMATTALTTLLTVVASQLVTSSLPEEIDWSWLPWFLTWAVLAAGLRIFSEIYRAYYRYAMSYSIGGQSGGLMLNALMVLFSIIGIITGQISLQGILGIQIVIQMGLLRTCLSDLRGHVTSKKRHVNGRLMWIILASAWPLLAQQLVSVGLPEAGKLMLGVYATAQDAGLYNAAARLVVLAHVPLMVVNNAIQPFITELHASGKRTQLTTLLRGSATLAAIPCVAVFGAFLIIPEFVLQLTFGPGFEQAAAALRVLTIGSLAWVLSGSCGLVLMMTGHERSCMLGTILPGVIFLMICPWLIDRYGVAGAAAGSTFLQLTSNGLCMLLVFRHHGIWTAVTLSQSVVADCCDMVRVRKRDSIEKRWPC